MSDFALLFSLKHGLIHTCSVVRFITLCCTVELINIKIIRTKIFKSCIKMLPENLGRFGLSFGSDIDLITHTVERFAQLLFTVRICSRGIKESHSAFIRFSKKFNRRCHVHTLNGQSTESVLRSYYTCFPQYNIFHKHPSTNHLYTLHKKRIAQELPAQFLKLTVYSISLYWKICSMYAGVG